MAIPATIFFIGTPAARSERHPPQVEACEDDPLDSMISETTRIVYGNSDFDGIIGARERRAR